LEGGTAGNFTQSVDRMKIISVFKEPVNFKLCAGDSGERIYFDCMSARRYKNRRADCISAFRGCYG
jgi:hypothetical protein